MTINEKNIAKRRNPPPVTREEQPLLSALVSEATRRGDTLAALAKQLGVTYERLAQWRRNDALIAKANRSVLEKAATYLGLPTVLVLLMAGLAGLDDFVWPSRDPLKERVGRELERMRQDPYIGPFVPKELAAASPAVKFFVTFMFHELESSASHSPPAYGWLSALLLASAGHQQGQRELQRIREAAADSRSIF